MKHENPSGITISPHSSDDDFDYFEHDFDDREDEDEFFDCSMGPDGYCGAAGSEWCEFECPFRRAQR